MHSDKDITLTVYAPRFPDPKTFTWEKNTKVGDAAKQAAEAFGYAVTNPTFQKGTDVLDRNKPLVAEKLKDGDQVQIVDTGGGV